MPCRGDVVWINLKQKVGLDQIGQRSALVLSPLAYNDRVGLALMCPITHHVVGYPFEVAIPDGLAVSGVILADHVKSLGWQERRAELLCTLPPEVVGEVLGKLGALLA